MASRMALVSSCSGLSFLFLGFLTLWVATSASPATATWSSQSRSGSALKVTGFRVPSLALYGSDVELDCPFTAPVRMKLYSVKWYHNSDEFYRYIFADPTPVFTFPLPGIYVDLNRSNSSRVTLRSVNFHTSATFRCEVSADAPDFQTVHRRANMTIFQVSDDGPFIQGLRDRYEANELLEADCSTPYIDPADITTKHPTFLTWHLNGRPIGSREVDMVSDPSSTVIHIRQNLTEEHFDRRTGLLRLNCTLTIGRYGSNHQHQPYHVLFSRSAETKASVIPKRQFIHFMPDQRQYRSAASSSGDWSGCPSDRLPLVTLLAGFMLYQFHDGCYCRCL